MQAKEAIFNDRRGRRIYGWQNDRGEELFPTRYALDPIGIAEKIGNILIEEGRGTDRVKAGLAQLAEARRADNAQDLAARLPYFCSGCPHNSSTRLPEGSRAYAGIGCHYMVQWMDRDTVGFTQMGGEGANWIGEAPFPNARMCSRISATAPTTTRAFRRSGRRSPPAPRSPTRSSSTMPWP